MTTKTGTTHEAGMAAARAWARWYIGDPSHASDIIFAYLNPERALELLEEEKKA